MCSVNNRKPRPKQCLLEFSVSLSTCPRRDRCYISEKPRLRHERVIVDVKKKLTQETCLGGPPTRIRAKGSGSKFESGHVIASRISYKSPSNVKIVHVPRAPTLRIVRKMRSLVVWCAVVWALATLAPLVPRAGACSSSISKRPARVARPRPGPPPRPQPQPRLNVTFPTFKCEPDYSEYYCLNGGVCFTVVISDSPIYNCECRSGFVGQRCEFKDLDDSYVLTSRHLMMETASIAGGATVAVFLAILVCFGAWVRLHRRGKQPPYQEERGHVQLCIGSVQPTLLTSIELLYVVMLLALCVGYRSAALSMSRLSGSYWDMYLVSK
ncbi:hypothetical protein NE865_15817 [Phthorimaea operculella]|nr:hypothetical protein NE865_15817 [Phthorimaea operculella]